ncbi:class I SAM-dependent methyltransferase [soil metagenome]
MEILNALAEIYAHKFSSSEDDLLKEINEFTIAHHKHAHMISGHLQGKFLQMISCLVQPQQILEIGTFTGYSALCLAKGLNHSGSLHTIELRTEDANIAKGFFSKSLKKNQIFLHEGDALKIIPNLKQQWDIIFIDADKINYIHYYELTLPQLKPNGLIIADNVLFHGEVLEETIKGKNAIAIHAFNRHVADDNRTEQVMLTLRDGVSLIRKL